MGVAGATIDTSGGRLRLEQTRGGPTSEPLGAALHGALVVRRDECPDLPPDLLDDLVVDADQPHPVLVAAVQGRRRTAGEEVVARHRKGPLGTGRRVLDAGKVHRGAALEGAAGLQLGVDLDLRSACPFI